MNKVHKYLTILASSILLLSAVSCEQLGPTVSGGADVAFSAKAEGSENIESKASYGGDASRYTESSKTYEKIYWSTGDVVRIYCSQGDTTEIHDAAVRAGKAYVGKPHVYIADYRIDEVDESDNTLSKIVLNSSTTPIGLRWNQDESKKHTFWAVYPAPTMGGITSSYGINGKTIYGNLLSEQNTLENALSNDGNGNYTLAPDMKWMMMHGHVRNLTRATFPSTGTVFLSFKPLTTAIRFTIENSVAKDLVIKQLNLISTAHQIRGSFKISNVEDTDAEGFPTATFQSGSTKRNTVSLTLSENVTIKQNKKFTFTFFLAPVADLDDLKFQIVRGGDDDGATLTTRLGYTDGTGVKFPRCKKSFVTGIMVPEGVQWTIDYEPVLTDWEEGGSETLSLN